MHVNLVADRFNRPPMPIFVMEVPTVLFGFLHFGVRIAYGIQKVESCFYLVEQLVGLVGELRSRSVKAIIPVRIFEANRVNQFGRIVELSLRWKENLRVTDYFDRETIPRTIFVQKHI